MANGYGGSSGSSGSSSPSYSSSSSTARTSRAPAPPGFHYMPDGTLMSDAEHEKLYNQSMQDEKPKVIKGFKINTNDIKASGETRSFTITGDNNCIFTLIIINNHDNYYNFDTQTFSTTPSRLDSAAIKGGSYSGFIKFPALPDTNTDDYTIHLIADIRNKTRHTSFVEARYEDNTIDFNSSRGSDSTVLLKKLYQHADKTITLTAISPNAITAFNSLSVTNQEITSQGKNNQKSSFTIVVTAASTRNFVIKKQIEENDFITFVERTIGSAAVPITGEDISGSTYYRWPIDNVVGLQNGMFFVGNNVAAGSQISDYVQTASETVVERSRKTKDIILEKQSKKNTTIVYEKGVKPTGVATVTNGVLTSQSGEIILNRKQVDALKDDTVKIYGYGSGSIKSLTGYEVKLSNLKVELTPVTTTTTGSTVGSASTSVAIAERNGIQDGVSTVTGIGIDTSSSVPSVVSGAGTVNGAGTVVLSAAQELESGVTLTFSGASRVATITGDIEVVQSGSSDVAIRIDLERIIKAT